MRNIGHIDARGLHLPASITHPQQIYWRTRRRVPLRLRQAVAQVCGRSLLPVDIDAVIATQDAGLVRIGKRRGSSWPIFTYDHSDKAVGAAFVQNRIARESSN